MKKIIIITTLFCLMVLPNMTKALDHGGIASIALSPVSPQVKAGETITFTLTAKDSNGVTWDITPAAAFLTADPRGLMEKNIYQSGKIGSFEVSVLYGSLTEKTTVTVLPGDLASIQVNPNSQPEIINLGNKITFTAQGFDKMSNALNGLTYSWSTEGNLGKIDQNGVFTANSKGEGKIIASLGAVSGSSAIKVKEKTVVPTTTINTNTTKPKTNTNPNNNTNGNVNGQVAGAETVSAAEKTDTKNDCQTLAWYWWVLIMLAFFAISIFYYYFIRKTKGGWWWIFPLLFTAFIIWGYYQYACNLYGWWPWVTIVMAILIALFRPKKYFEEPKSPAF